MSRGPHGPQPYAGTKHLGWDTMGCLLCRGTVAVSSLSSPSFRVSDTTYYYYCYLLRVTKFAHFPRGRGGTGCGRSRTNRYYNMPNVSTLDSLGCAVALFTLYAQVPQLASSQD